MKIGIDIDDTITDSWECCIPYYSRLFNIPEDMKHFKDMTINNIVQYSKT